MKNVDLEKTHLVELNFKERSDINGGGSIAYWFGYACGFYWKAMTDNPYLT